MSKLMSLFRDKMDKSKDKSAGSKAVFDVMYPTGFLALDHLNGTMIHVKTDTIDMSYKSIGIMDGSANAFIGRAGCGKSTICIQIIGELMKQFPTAEAYMDDIEGSLPIPRKEFLLGLTKDEIKNRVDMRNTGITTENVYYRIKALHDIKMENKKEYEYDTGLYDTDGNRIFKLIPTMYFIDSFAMLMPNEIATEEEIANGMGTASIAKLNTQLVKKISQLLKESNIILFTINHILDDIQIGFLPKPVQLAGLKQGERLPGGKAYIYISNNMFRLDEKSTLKATEGYYIDGTVVDITIVKSRTNATKKSVPLIFNKSKGYFDKTLSLYHFLKIEGYIGGAGKSMYLNNAPDIKFSQKEFKTKLMNDPDLQKAFSIAAKEAMDNLLSETRNCEAESDFDLNASILSLN